jgi:DNA-binding response OmpR family regulator
MNPKKILIIEDELDFCAAVKLLLESNGYSVIQARDGLTGLMMARKEHPDLVLLDLLLPKLDGFKILRFLKFDDKYKKIPIIIISAMASMQSRNQGLELGADDYLIKPFKSEDLLNSIKKFLVHKSK